MLFCKTILTPKKANRTLLPILSAAQAVNSCARPREFGRKLVRRLRDEWRAGALGEWFLRRMKRLRRYKYSINRPGQCVFASRWRHGWEYPCGASAESYFNRNCVLHHSSAVMFKHNAYRTAENLGEPVMPVEQPFQNPDRTRVSVRKSDVLHGFCILFLMASSGFVRFGKARQ